MSSMTTRQKLRSQLPHINKNTTKQGVALTGRKRTGPVQCRPPDGPRARRHFDRRTVQKCFIISV